MRMKKTIGMLFSNGSKPRPRTTWRQAVRRVVLLMLAVAVCVTAPDTACATTAGWSTPGLDTWFYTNAIGPGSRAFGPTFAGDLSINSGTGEFEPLTVADPARLGMVLAAFDTSTQITTGLPTGQYQINSVTATFTLAGSSANPVYYQDTPISNENIRAEVSSGSVTAQRPMELYGVGLRGGYTGYEFSNESTGPPLLDDITHPYAASDGGYIAYPIVGVAGQAGQYADVSNNVTGGYSATEADSFTEPFDPAWAIGTTDLSPGDAITNDKTFTFQLDLNLPGVRDYVRQSLADGALGLMLSSLHITGEEGQGGSYPQWYMAESVGAIFHGTAPTLSIDYAIIAESLAGDYNENDVIDAADYTVWRNALAAGLNTLPNRNLSKSGPVDEDDFAFWRAHFGESLGGRAGAAQGQRAVRSSATAVPEPPSALLLYLGFVMLGACGLTPSRNKHPAAAGGLRRPELSDFRRSSSVEPSPCPFLRWMGFPRGAFISVGAVGQRLGDRIVWLMVRAWSLLRGIAVVALNCPGEIGSSVLRRFGRATRRWNSSLRSHRTWRSSCRHVFSGLNKTMFAPVGPNSHCRGHQEALPAGPGRSLFENESFLGRMKASRGHRSGGAATEATAAKIPHDVKDSLSPGLSDLFLSRQPRAVGSRGTVPGRPTLKGLAVADHRIEDPQQAAAHGDVRLGLADAADQPLTGRFLPHIALAQGDGRLAPRPTERDRAGLGDVAAGGASGRFLHVSGQAGPELQRVGVGETVKRADLGGDHRRPDLPDAGHAQQQRNERRETCAAGGEDDLAAESFPVTFGEHYDVNEVGEGLLLDRLQEVAVRQQPALGGGAVELGAADIGRVEHALHGMLAAGQQTAQVPPVPAQLAELHQLLVGDEAQRALAARQSRGDVQRIVPVGLAALASAAGQLGGVRDVDPLDAVAKTIDEPLHERAGFHRHPNGARQSARSQASILPVLFVLILSRLISPVASTAVSVTVHLCKSTPTND